MSDAHRTMHHAHTIGAGVGALFGGMMIDMLAARRRDAITQRMIARRVRIDAKLAMIREIRARRMGR